MEAIKPLNPIALELGPLSIRWYGIVIGIGLLLGLYIATNEAVKRGLQKEVFTDLVLWAAPIALICARIYYVIFNWSYYSQHPDEIIAIWKGGIAIHGALIGAIVTTVVFAKKKNLSFWKLADIAAPSIILGQAIGRWGNFMNQEAHGGPVSREFLESLQLPDFIINQMYIEGSYYHPTFLYESLWNLIGFLILLTLQRLNLKRGEVFLTYVIWYSIGRFFIEGIRTDSLMLTNNLKMAQVLSVVLVITSTVLILYKRTRKDLTARYKD
ncbi:prolipoprotein diacylglyceryl transferase [Geobacillus sp. 47C-IIb]|uniref:prolipoprotein diacylglyceryl transferase n=1 Tax=Geobacillus sp. 47C-IIb TaxID=1963026 RepID=UPI0009BF90D7|nr:prolipoprotein diacylglyceryl transferase [Geobacillus sp. 47C-IIb]OQP07391.1 prolipoprotein diacylglyceryl transferase [Geobacillus sp. 47C-IIb]